VEAALGLGVGGALTSAEGRLSMGGLAGLDITRVRGVPALPPPGRAMPDAWPLARRSGLGIEGESGGGEGRDDMLDERRGVGRGGAITGDVTERRLPLEDGLRNRLGKGGNCFSWSSRLRGDGCTSS
jgi:hypothetical protein